MIRLTEAEHDPWPLWRHALVVLLFSFATLFVVGYGFGSEDSANYIPLVWAHLEPGLYAGDTAFGWILASSWSHHAAFFAGGMAGLARLFTMEGAFLLAHGASLFALLWAWWLIGRAVGGPAAGYVTLLLLVTSRFVGGTRIFTLPHEFQPRVLASAIAFLAIASLLNGGHTRIASGLAGLATLLHPISALMALPVAALAPLMREASWRVRLRETGLAASLIVLPFLGWRLLSGGALADTPMTGRVSAGWQQIIDFRLQGQALNIGAWSPSEWLLVAIPLLFWFMGLHRRKPLTEVDRLLGVAVIASLTLAAAGSVAADIFRSTLGAQLMLSRLVYLPMVAGTAYMAWWLIGQWREGGWLVRTWALVAASAMALGSMPVALLAVLPIVLIHRTRQDGWLLLASQALALGWLGLAVAVAAQDRWIPRAPGMAAPDFGIFAEPPLINVLVVAALAAAMLVGARLARPARLLMLAAAVATAPLTIYLATHRHTPPIVALKSLAAGVQTPWTAPASDWQALAYWARSTPPGSRFLAPVHAQGFRAMAKRPIVTDWKDGGLTLFSESLAERWLSLYTEVGGYEKRSAAEIVTLARQHGCRYVVLPADRPFAATKVHVSGRLAVYELTTQGASRQP